MLKAHREGKKKFMDCVAQVSLESKKGLRGNVPTKWNSTYVMFDSALFIVVHLFIYS